ncbi:MAG: universal stress protein [Bacteroidetes bacterium]|nr:universal stress protein [Bacteroidota bacterium]
MKIKKILSPVDFSVNSLNALKYAADFARSSGATLFVLHVSDPDSLINDLKGNLSPEHMLDLLKKEPFLQGVKFNTILKKGNISNLILEESRRNDIDLVVMGTQGAGNMIRTLVGTNTTKVVEKSECAVLAVPLEATYSSIKKVVLAVDLEHRSDHLIEDLVNTVKIQQSAVLLVYVGVDKEGHFERDLEKLTDEMKSRTAYSKILCKVIHSDNFPGDLEGYALDIEADILVMITHHRGVFEAIFDPSETQLYAYHTTIPLMVIPMHKKPVFFL